MYVLVSALWYIFDLCQRSKVKTNPKHVRANSFQATEYTEIARISFLFEEAIPIHIYPQQLWILAAHRRAHDQKCPYFARSRYIQALIVCVHEKHNKFTPTNKAES